MPTTESLSNGSVWPPPVNAAGCAIAQNGAAGGVVFLPRTCSSVPIVERPVGWVERSEPHQETAESQVVGLAALDPPHFGRQAELRHLRGFFPPLAPQRDGVVQLRHRPLDFAGAAAKNSLAESTPQDHIQRGVNAVSPMQSQLAGLEVRAPAAGQAGEILSDDALRFVEKLVREFGPQRERAAPPPGRAATGIRRRASFPISSPKPQPSAGGDWSVAPIPDDLQDRRVEITGPTDRKMIINALNSGANVFMADFEDANSPDLAEPDRGPGEPLRRGRRHDPLHQPGGKAVSPQREDGHAHGPAARLAPAGKARVAGRQAGAGRRCSISACSSSTTPSKLLDQGSGPYFYLPKLESHLEARLWNDVFLMAQDELGIPRGSIRATVLIETIPAAFEMDEILYELREHSAGLNCGRWDYIFSIIKKFRKHPEFTMPDRGAGHHDHALHALLLAAGDQDLPSPRHPRHRRHGRADPDQERSRRPTKRRMEKVRADKVREAGDGHDGTWVAHPGLVAAGQGGLRRPHARAQPDRPPPRRRPGDGQGPAHRARAARSPSAGCARTSTWASSTWPPGWRATAACRSTTSWKTRPRPKSPARRSGSGSTSPTACLSDGRKVTPELVRALFDDADGQTETNGRARSRSPAATTTWPGS